MPAKRHSAGSDVADRSAAQCHHPDGETAESQQPDAQAAERKESEAKCAGCDVNTIVGPVYTGTAPGIGLGGVQQNFEIVPTGAGETAAPNGGNRFSYTKVLSILENNNLNNGVILMNRKTAKQFLTFDRSEIGGDLAQDLFQEGLTALQEATPRMTFSSSIGTFTITHLN